MEHIHPAIVNEPIITENTIKKLFFNSFISGYANTQLKTEELIDFNDNWWGVNKETILKTIIKYADTKK